jgi:hypothetical protein
MFEKKESPFPLIPRTSPLPGLHDISYLPSMMDEEIPHPIQSPGEIL